MQIPIPTPGAVLMGALVAIVLLIFRWVGIFMLVCLMGGGSRASAGCDWRSRAIVHGSRCRACQGDLESTHAYVALSSSEPLRRRSTSPWSSWAERLASSPEPFALDSLSPCTCCSRRAWLRRAARRALQRRW